MRLPVEAMETISTPSDARTDRRSTQLSPALSDLLQTFVAPGSRCLNVGGSNDEAVAVGSWLLDHGCVCVDVAASQATALPQKDKSFDAALLIDVLDELGEPQWAATELRRVLCPGGVLVVTAPNAAYWRQRLDRSATCAHHPSLGSIPPNSLRRLLLQSGFRLVGVEGQEGGFIGELPFAGRRWKRHTSRPYRAAERLFPSLLGARVGAFAIRVGHDQPWHGSSCGSLRQSTRASHAVAWRPGRGALPRAGCWRMVSVGSNHSRANSA